MARLTDQERAARQALKVEQERAKLAQLNARISARERKLETQRKIIIGGMVLAEARDDPAFAGQIARLIRKRVTRPQDKNALGEMFGEPAKGSFAVGGGILR